MVAWPGWGYGGVRRTPPACREPTAKVCTQENISAQIYVTASGNIIGSAEALPILCVRYFW